MTSGFRFVGPFAHQTFASYGSCSSDQSFAYGFLPTSHCCDAVATSAKGSCHQGPQRTLTSKSFPVSLSLHGYQRQSLALRAMLGAPKKGPQQKLRAFTF
jgi:hypothetical protein